MIQLSQEVTLMDKKRNIKKELSLPASVELGPGGSLSWEKKHGFAGATTLTRVRAAAKAAGWEPEGESSTATQSDNVRNYTKYVDPKGEYTLSVESFYGQTSYDNRFGLIVKRVSKVKE